MKICKIYIKNFEQFQDVELDFTNPETGEPLDKICFIGSNGTGKSKLLFNIKMLFEKLIRGIQSCKTNYYLSTNEESKVIYKIKYLENHYFVYHLDNRVYFFKENAKKIQETEFVKKIFDEDQELQFSSDYWRDFRRGLLNDQFLIDFEFKNNSNDLVIYSPAESSHNGYKDIKDVPVTSVSDALELSKQFPYLAEVSSNTVNDFWRLLVFNMRKRAEERDNYENRSENLSKTKQQLIDEFDLIYPKVLENLGIVWNKILDKAGLRFDIKGASNPYQLADNLKAYIKLKRFETTIPYNALSTGIRNYIFRVGHIFSLYFNRDIDRGFLLVDEPENSLFPDFLFDLMETYNEVIFDRRRQNNTQVFFATHNPIIAAQFKPYERVILVWNEDGTVKAISGSAPEGDDPNDLLKKDFGIRELMGQKGIEVWNYYLALKRKLKKTETTEEKMELAAEINKIGQLYNFPA